MKVKLRPLEKELAKIEARLASLTRESEASRAALADPALYAESERERLRELTIADARIARELSAVEEDWLHASAKIEALRGELSESR
jgi:ATP-binding cassette subfamily F protein 3